jgi:hypothetical protein
MGWAARAHKAQERWGLMKSFCLSLIELYTLREVIQTPPKVSDPNGAKGYSESDLASLDDVCLAIDGRIGPYRKTRRTLTQKFERDLRAVHRIASREERTYQEQLLNDTSVEALDALDAEMEIEQRLVVSLETAEMSWLQENWKQRSDWMGADQSRARIRGITKAFKDDHLIEWKPAEKEIEPDVADFDRPKAGEVPSPTSNGKAKDAKDLAPV